MRRRRPLIIQKTPVFLGCEGESEQGYGQLLNDLLHAADLPIHLEVVNLSPGAGDPIARLQRAEKEITRRQKRRSVFDDRAVLMDSDQLAGNSQRRQEVEQLALQMEISIIWQEPCHEAFLLRHMDGYAQNRPLTTQAAIAALEAVWPQYNKPMTKILLARRIGRAEVLRAATVEASLAAFLRRISLLA